MQDNNLEDAIYLFSQALQKRIEKYGDEALECASAYCQYGSVLFLRAQEESDVFGDTLKSTVQGTEAQPAPSTAAAAEEAVDDDGSDADDAGEDAAEGVEGGEDDETPSDDMQLAWENLEVARTIYSRDKDAHKTELADIHLLLADLATEQESFDTALTEYRSSLSLMSSIVKENDRCLAELHYKTSLTLQFLEQPEEAAKEILVASNICKAKLDELKGASDEAVAKEAKDLELVLEDLKDKEDEYKEAIQEREKTKESLRSVLQQAMGTVQPLQSSSNAGQVVDLGVVGQGKKRINLAALSNDKAVASHEGSRPKRSLDDLLGTSDKGFKFDPPPASHNTNGGAAKKALTESNKVQVANTVKSPHSLDQTKDASEKKSSLPAFLQPGNVKAIYGKDRVDESSKAGTTPAGS